MFITIYKIKKIYSALQKYSDPNYLNCFKLKALKLCYVYV